MGSNAWPGQPKAWDLETVDPRDRNQPRQKAKVLGFLAQSPWSVATVVGLVIVALVLVFMPKSAEEIQTDDFAPTGGPPGGRHQWRLKPFRDAKIEEELDKSQTDCDPHDNADPSEFCSYVENTPTCTEGDQFLHYLSFHFCVLEGYPWISTAILFGWALLLFYTLSQVADRFFCPALENIADLMGLPADVAGATLLSFGNGAPDVFTQIAATSGGENGDVDLAVGSVLGAGLFICSAVLALVALLTPSVAVVVKRIFLRDVIFYLAAMLLFVFIMSSGAVVPWHTFALVALYLAYLTYTVLGNRIHGSLASEEELPPALGPSHAPSFVSKAATTPGLANRISTPTTPGTELQEASRPLLVHATGPERASQPHVSHRHHHHHHHHHHHDRGDSRDVGRCLPWCGMLVSWIRKESGWDEMGPLRRLAVPFTVPILFLMRLTMPEVGDDHYPRPFAVLLPLGAPLFFLLVESIQLSKTQMVLGGALSLGLCVFMLASYPSERDGPHVPSSGFTKAFSIVAFLQAIVWMDVAAGELVALFKAFGTMFNVSQVFLGATILAWGNSIGDLVANSSVAKSGRTTMAVTACFAGPLFNVLAGMSLSLSLMTAMGNAVPLKPMGSAMITLFGFQITFLVGMLVLVPTVCAWKITRRMGVVLLLFYAVFNVVYVGVDVFS